eukprot:m.292736 g.292736  ORF g.292736 m.292736 type:complete len:1045 (-) comp15844_c0_seq8:2262-5396(-)
MAAEAEIGGSPLLTVQGVDIHFPFSPYACQRDYMDRLIQALKEQSNAMLESPTGTGKTLCLLCATLAWRSLFVAQHQQMQLPMHSEFAQEMKKQLAAATTSAKPIDSAKAIEAKEAAKIGLMSASASVSAGGSGWSMEGTAQVSSDGATLGIPKIIFSSRTHSQLSQAVSELKNTAYSVTSCVLGSRDQMCIHPEVSSLESNAAKTRVCRAKRLARQCPFAFNVEETYAGMDKTAVMDIEDLVRFGREHRCCPYYLAREGQNDAAITFVPYNYLVDPQSRKAQKIDVNDAVVIFDEAHNIESVCEESASFELTSTDLAQCRAEMHKLLRMLDDHEELVESDIQSMVLVFAELERLLDAVPVNSDKLFQQRGDYIYDFFHASNITDANVQAVLGVLDTCANVLAEDMGARGKTRITKVIDILQKLFDPAYRLSRDAVKEYYYVNVQQHPKLKAKRSSAPSWSGSKADQASDKPPRTLGFWCFSPGFAMNRLARDNVRSIVLTSGTLAPLDSFASELMTPFPIRLENPHIISAKQVFAAVVRTGPTGAVLSSTYANRQNPRYISDLGNTIVNLCHAIPKGVLVFFPSYGFMETCLSQWKAVSSQQTIWDRIAAIKRPVTEPRDKREFSAAMQAFYQVLDATNEGAIFFAVCRGKVSEGLDFANDYGRAVIITGLPYPAFKDPRVVLKQKFMNDYRSKRGSGITGREWYDTQAFRAVNQAIGRVIRHRNDYGAIIFADDRFANNLDKLPLWLRQHVKIHGKFGSVQQQVTHFFRAIAANPHLSEQKTSSARVTPSVKIMAALPPPVSDKSAAARSQLVRRESSKAHIAVAYDLAASVPTGSTLPLAQSAKSGHSTGLRKLTASRPGRDARSTAQGQSKTSSSSTAAFQDPIPFNPFRPGAATAISTEASQITSAVPPVATSSISAKGQRKANVLTKAKKPKRDLFAATSAESFNEQAKARMRQYVASVKSRCTPKAYTQFIKSVALYKKNMEAEGQQAALELFAATLLSLFTHQDGTHDLLGKFAGCLPPTQRTAYRTILEQHGVKP